MWRHGAGSYRTYPIKDFEKLIKAGRTVIAIEGHNEEADSAGFSLDPYLVAGKTGPVAGGKPSRVSPFSLTQ